MLLAKQKQFVRNAFWDRALVHVSFFGKHKHALSLQILGKCMFLLDCTEKLLELNHAGKLSHRNCMQKLFLCARECVEACLTIAQDESCVASNSEDFYARLESQEGLDQC